MWRFLTGVKPPPQKKTKLSEMDARDKKKKKENKNCRKHGKTSDLGCTSHQMA